MTSDEEIQAAKQSTAKALGEEIDSLDYITAELLAVEVISDEPPYESDDQEGVVPNRIT